MREHAAAAVPADLLAQLPGMAPGAELAAALAALHLPTVPNGRVIDVLQAQSRQLAHEHARLAATLVEVARTTPYFGPDDPASTWTSAAERAAEDQEWAEGEIAAALAWTAGKAGWELRHAHRLLDVLPAVHAALSAGRIDRQRADVFVDYLNPETTTLSRAQIDRLVEQFLPPAEQWTRRQLAARLLRAIIAIDPDAARARYQRAVRDRGVVCQLDEESGTAMVTGAGLPPDEATAACARLDRLADTIQRAGHPGGCATSPPTCSWACSMGAGPATPRPRSSPTCWPGAGPKTGSPNRNSPTSPLPDRKPQPPPRPRPPPLPRRARAGSPPTRPIDAPRRRRTRARPNPPPAPIRARAGSTPTRAIDAPRRRRTRA
jgi:hypothetical protein